MISLYLATAVWAIALVVYKLIASIRKAYLTPLRKVPGPWHAKFSNLRLKYAIVTGTRTEYIHSLHQRYGPFVRIEPDEVAVADLQATKEIHKIGGGFLKAEFYRNMRTGAPDGPDALFSMVNPKQHAARRKLFARGFSQFALREQWEPLVQERVRLAVQRMKEESAAKGATDILKWWMFMATDVSANVMFGDSFHMLESGQKVDYIRAIEHSLLGTVLMTELWPVWRIFRAFPFGALRSICYANAILLEQGKQAMRNIKQTQHASSIFDQMAAKSEKEDELLTEEDVVSEAANFILAGTDTTANTATYMIWALLNHPQARRALEQELDTVQEPLSDAKLEELPVLGACVEETLRLYGAAPASEPRSVPDGGATLGGYYLPGGATVSTQSWTTHRQPDLFPEPYKFDITRWLEPGRVSPAAKQAMAPFGHGARICMGIHLAKMELRLAAAVFIRECKNARIASSTTPQSMEIVNHFLIAPKSGKCEIVIG